MTENYSGLAGTKNAFRVEGNWKAGSVYVWVVSDEGVVVFHGLERDQESKPTNLDREDSNGIKFMEDLIAAGVAGGGYVEYHDDNPMIDGDEETGSPKLATLSPSLCPGRKLLSLSARAFTSATSCKRVYRVRDSQSAGGNGLPRPLLPN